MKTNVFGLVAALVLAVVCGQAGAQNYPSKPIHVMVGYTPGGGTDLVARIIAQKLSERLGQPVIVENKPGANATIATDYVAKAPPDGYTLLIAGSSETVYSRGFYSKLPYDTLRDLVPIISITSNPMLFTVNPSVPVTTVKELIALSKSKPGKLFYSAGALPFQVAGELFKRQTGADLTFVAYKGSSPATIAAVNGEVAMTITAPSSAIGFMNAGKLRILAVTSSKRYPPLPDIPTMAESGIADFIAAPGHGLFAPIATPRSIVDKLATEVTAILKMDDVRSRLSFLGLVIGGQSGAEYASALKADIEKWTKAMHDANIHGD